MAEARSGHAGPEPWRDPGAEPYIRIEHVTKTFGGVMAVEDVSLKIYRGELFSLLGASGCGKTTLLRMLAGFERPSAGSIFIDGVDMSDIPPYARPVNMMFQSYALFPHMTVESNVAFGLKQDRLARAEIKRRVADILDLVELGPMARRKPHQLSGGQSQRVALARSLVKQPKLLLLDEPLAALDRKLREQTQFELVNIQKRVGVTFIVVTHDQQEAMTLSTRIAVMDRGRIVQVGAPPEIYETPNCRFVADFIGSINMFEGRLLENQGDHALIESAEAGCKLRVEGGPTGPEGMRVCVALRPEKIQLTKTRPTEPHNWATGRIAEIAYLGNMSIYQVTLATGKTVRVTTPNLERGPATELGSRDQVFLSWRVSSAIVLTS